MKRILLSLSVAALLAVAGGSFARAAIVEGPSIQKVTVTTQGLPRDYSHDLTLLTNGGYGFILPGNGLVASGRFAQNEHIRSLDIKSLNGRTVTCSLMKSHVEAQGMERVKSLVIMLNTSTKGGHTDVQSCRAKIIMEGKAGTAPSMLKMKS